MLARFAAQSTTIAAVGVEETNAVRANIGHTVSQQAGATSQ
jgi:hypothetical protein